MPGIGRRASAKAKGTASAVVITVAASADAQRVDDGGAIERPAQHLGVVGQRQPLALGIEQAGAEDVEQRIEQEDAEEEEAQGRRWRAAGAAGAGWKASRQHRQPRRVVGRASRAAPASHLVLRRVEHRRLEHRAVAEAHIEARRSGPASRPAPPCPDEDRPARRRVGGEAQRLGPQRHQHCAPPAERAAPDQRLVVPMNSAAKREAGWR